VRPPLKLPVAGWLFAAAVAAWLAGCLGCNLNRPEPATLVLRGGSVRTTSVTSRTSPQCRSLGERIGAGGLRRGGAGRHPHGRGAYQSTGSVNCGLVSAAIWWSRQAPSMKR
jgi:hypothetical protein